MTPSDNIRPPSRSLHPLRALLPFVQPYRGLLLLALLALLAAAGTTLMLPIAVRLTIDHGFAGNDPDAINRQFLLLFGVTTALALATACRYYLISRLGERIIADLRIAVYRHVLRLDPSFFEQTSTGEVLSRLTTDTTLIQSIVGYGASVALRNVLLLVGGLVMLAITSPSLTGLILLLIPAVVIPVILVGRRVRALSRSSQDTIADGSAIAGETLNAIQIVQAYTREPHEQMRYNESIETSYNVAMRRIRVRALLVAMAIAAVTGAIALVLWLGARAVLEGQMSPGELGQFIIYAVLVAGAGGALSEVWGELQRAAGATERLMELLEAQSTIQSTPCVITLQTPVSGAIHFDRVTFAYPSRPNQPALSDFSLNIHPGETVALVGPSGAGKSTVFQLLLRFYQPAAGHILLDEQDIAQLPSDFLRQQLALVPQESVIFAATALENIRYGRLDALDEDVHLAARHAAAEDFIRAQPQGWQSFLGERGLRLSGGQRQRIAIARAILRNAPILLLDEATSALDAESEQLVQQALDHLMHERTTVVIAHRLATVQRADRIVVMNEGRIVAMGDHSHLMRQGGLYARLAKLQFRDSPAETQLRQEVVS